MRTFGWAGAVVIVVFGATTRFPMTPYTAAMVATAVRVATAVMVAPAVREAMAARRASPSIGTAKYGMTAMATTTPTMPPWKTPTLAPSNRLRAVVTPRAAPRMTSRTSTCPSLAIKDARGVVEVLGSYERGFGWRWSGA
jgi:hypothetical protein